MERRIDFWSIRNGLYARWIMEAGGIHINGVYITGHDMSVNMDGRSLEIAAGGVTLVERKWVVANLMITAGNTEDWWDIPNTAAIDTKKVHVWTWPWSDGKTVHVVCPDGEDITCNVERLGGGETGWIA